MVRFTYCFKRTYDPFGIGNQMCSAYCEFSVENQIAICTAVQNNIPRIVVYHYENYGEFKDQIYTYVVCTSNRTVTQCTDPFKPIESMTDEIYDLSLIPV